MEQMTTSQNHIPCPIWSMLAMCKKTVYIFLTKRRIKSNCDFDSTSQIQHKEENFKQVILDIVYSLSYMLETVVTKTLDIICILNYVVNNKESYDNNKNTNSNDNDTNSDDNNINYTNNDYDDNHDNNYIDNNFDNNGTKNYNPYRSDSTIIDNIQPNSTTISKDCECDENISKNTPSVSETLDTTTKTDSQPSIDILVSIPSSTGKDITLLQTSQFKSFVPNILIQEDIDDGLCLPFSYQYMFDKRTSPWEMKDWDQDELNDFVIEPEKIDRLYHMVADDEDQNFRSWEICCRMEYKGEKHFVEMYANCDYTGFDCQGGGHVSITKLPDFFLENMVTMDQNPGQIYKSLREDGYNVQEPDLLHKVHPKFWNNAPMLKYLCHNAIYKHRDVLPHFKDQLPKILANSVDEFIKVKDWDNE